jgi:putative SOS response-associated peptidase YedK
MAGMCGRFVAAQEADDLAAYFDATDETGLRVLSWNVAPTDTVPIVVARPDGGRRLVEARWGLQPPWWAEKSGRRGPWINARAETVARSSAFRDAVRQRRCLVPADGWYEWMPDPAGAAKAPRYMTPAGGEPLGFAGLYETVVDGDGEHVSCAIVTTAAAPALAAVHDRMPLLLDRADWPAWLDPAREDVADLLAAPVPAHLVDAIGIRPVDRAVGNVRNNHAGLVEPLAEEPQRLG